MAQGLPTGKFGPDHQFEKGDHRSGNRLFQADVYHQVQQALAALRPIAEKKGITMAQLAPAWVIAKPGVHAPLPVPAMPIRRSTTPVQERPP